MLLVAQSQIRGEADHQGPVQVSFEVGYWLTLTALAGGAAFSVRAIQEQKGQENPPTEREI